MELFVKQKKEEKTIHKSVTKEKFLPQPTDIPLLLERIVLELSTFSAKKKNLLD